MTNLGLLVIFIKLSVIINKNLIKKSYCKIATEGFFSFQLLTVIISTFYNYILIDIHKELPYT